MAVTPFANALALMQSYAKPLISRPQLPSGLSIYLCTYHISDVAWGSWHLMPMTTRLFVQQLALINNKEIILTPHYWPVVKGTTRLAVDSAHKGPVMWKIFPCHDIMIEKVFSCHDVVWKTCFHIITWTCLCLFTELVYMDTHQLDRSASSCWSPRNDEVLTGAPAVTKSCSVDSLLRHNRSSVNRDFSRRLSQPPEICEERPFVHRSQSDECTSKLSEWRPLVPPRKPRMGQSALSSSAVLPVSMNRSSSPATVKHDENFNPTTNATPFKREGSKRGGMTEDNFRHMFSCEDTEALQDFQGNTSVEPVSVTAPRLPPRRPSQDNQEVSVSHFSCRVYFGEHKNLFVFFIFLLTERT